MLFNMTCLIGITMSFLGLLTMSAMHDDSFVISVAEWVKGLNELHKERVYRAQLGRIEQPLFSPEEEEAILSTVVGVNHTPPLV